MKRFIAVLPVLIIAIVLILSVAGCDSPLIDLSALTDNNGTIMDPSDEDYPDKLYTGDESSAELVLFRAGDVYFTYSRDKNYWVSLIGNVPDTMSLNDGEFALITADIKRYSGGIAGYMGNPSIVKLISYEPMTYDRAVTFCGLKAYCSAPAAFIVTGSLWESIIHSSKPKPQWGLVRYRTPVWKWSGSARSTRKWYASETATLFS